METVDSTLDTLKTVRSDLDRYERVREIVARQGNSPARLIPILREIQDQFHYLPEDLLEFLSGLLEIPAARVYGVATFYTHFSLEPRGRHIIQVCDGTACHVKRSESLIRAMRERLGLKAGQRTSEDLSFSLETV
ncbi:MAG TPA: NAD(P)H-dependent oxidoreductase subunit E, partial [Candidatus Hydrogenedentes bacterium]|nr:NAD(P)H-dependent oxidoreductase subunit E [Candidatus Hydrogenedentota bacterium]